MKLHHHIVRHAKRHADTVRAHPFRAVVTVILLAVSAYFLFILLRSRYQLGMIRYYDMDEFSYLNWAAHVYMGSRPYLDFMFWVTPLYLVVLTPLYAFFQGVQFALAARAFSFVVSLLAYGAVGYLLWEMRRSWMAVAAVLAFIVLPMPADKIMEIRTDTFATMLLLFALAFTVRFLNGRKIHPVVPGLFFGLATLASQKIVLGAGIGAAFFLASLLKKEYRKTWFVHLKYFVLGGVTPWLVFAAWAVTTGNPGYILYAITKLPVEFASSNVRFNWVPQLFYFQPNPTYYGSWGNSPGFLLNTGMWIFSGVVAAVRLLTSVLPGKKHRLADAMVPLVFFVLAYFYFYLSPLKFPQYLIPAAAFVGLFIGDFFVLLWNAVNRNRVAMAVFAVVYVFSLYKAEWTYRMVTAVKFYWTNEVNLTKMQRIFDTIQDGEYVLDLEGRTVKYPYPYPICCHAFGQFADAVSRPLPELIPYLEKTKTKYIYQAEIDRIGALLPRDRDWIHEHYHPTLNGELWVRNE